MINKVIFFTPGIKKKINQLEFIRLDYMDKWMFNGIAKSVERQNTDLCFEMDDGNLN